MTTSKSILFSYLPCSGLFHVLLCSLACVGTVLLSATDHTNGQGMYRTGILVTIYLSFSLSGMLDILMFYTNRIKIPKHCNKMFTAIAFLMELVLANAYGNWVEPSEICLTVSIIASLISTVFSIQCSTSGTITHLSMIMFTQVQGSWLIHSSLLPCSVTRKMCFLLLSWHIIAIFSLYILMVSLTSLLRNKNVNRTVKRIEENGRIFTNGESVERLIAKDAINDTVEIEPSFYHKEDISDDVKSVMRHIDNMIIEVSKPLEEGK